MLAELWGHLHIEFVDNLDSLAAIYSGAKGAAPLGANITLANN
jgi:hypothetical protein